MQYVILVINFFFKSPDSAKLVQRVAVYLSSMCSCCVPVWVSKESKTIFSGSFPGKKREKNLVQKRQSPYILSVSLANTFEYIFSLASFKWQWHHLASTARARISRLLFFCCAYSHLKWWCRHSCSNDRFFVCVYVGWRYIDPTFRKFRATKSAHVRVLCSSETSNDISGGLGSVGYLKWQANRALEFISI